MRAAPPLRLQVCADRRVQGLVTGLALLACAVLLLAIGQHLPQVWPAAVLLPVVALMAWRLSVALPRRLRWDGQTWWLATPPAVQVEQQVSLDVVIDLDRWVLLRARSSLPRSTLYLPLAQDHHPETWGALRATLFAARGGAQR